MEEPTGPDPRLDGPVDQIEAQTARYHAVSASMSSTHMPTWPSPWRSTTTTWPWPAPGDGWGPCPASEQVWTDPDLVLRFIRAAHRRARDRTRRTPPPHAGTSRPGPFCGTCGGHRGPHTVHHDQAAHERARRRELRR
jgi:hypothetical protein